MNEIRETPSSVKSAAPVQTRERRERGRQPPQSLPLIYRIVFYLRLSEIITCTVYRNFKAFRKISKFCGII